MSDAIALLASLLLVFLSVAVALFINRFCHAGTEVSRKSVHMIVSLWIFIPVYWMKAPAARLIGPFAFTVINALLVQRGIGKSIGMGDRKRDNGLVFFPFSLLVLVLLFSCGVLSSYSVIAGVLTMGFGDGIAAIAGRGPGRHRYRVFSDKSAEGSIAMLLSSLAIALVFTPLGWLSLPVAIASAAIEAISPPGYDNLTVPLLASALTEVLCSL